MSETHIADSPYAIQRAWFAREAFRAITDRSLSAAVVYPILLVAIDRVTPIGRRFPSLFPWVLGIGLLVSLGHLAALLVLRRRAGEGIGLRYALLASRLACAALFGALACVSIVGFELGWTSFFTLLVTFTISAIEVPSLAPARRLVRASLLLLIGPALIADWLLVEGLKGTALGVFLLGFAAILAWQARVQNRQFRDATRNSARLKAMLDAVPGTVSWISSNLTYLGVNSRLASLWKKDPADFVGQPVGFLNPESGLKDFARELFEGKEELLAREIARETPEDQRLYFLSGRRYGHSSEAVMLGVDITDYKRKLQEIGFRKAQSLSAARLATLGEVVTNLADELDSPLPGARERLHKLKNWTLLGQEDQQATLEVLGDLDQVFSRISRLATLLSRLSRHRGEDELRTYPIDDMLQDLTILCSQRASRYSVAFSAENRSGEVYFRCYPSRVLEVLVNLTNNSLDAIRHRPEKWIRVEVTQVDGILEIRVVDSGSGIPAEHKAKIFESLFTTKQDGSGTGVGLSVSREIIEGEGGKIAYDETAANTTFVVSLPMVREEPARESA